MITLLLPPDMMIQSQETGERLVHYEAEYDKIKSANSILIVGGGPTGVELAGELSIDFPEKKVTLVHRGSRLLEFISPKASKKTLDWLVSKKVEVILGQSVDLDSMSGGIYRTSGAKLSVLIVTLFVLGSRSARPGFNRLS